MRTALDIKQCCQVMYLQTDGVAYGGSERTISCNHEITYGMHALSVAVCRLLSATIARH